MYYTYYILNHIHIPIYTPLYIYIYICICITITFNIMIAVAMDSVVTDSFVRLTTFFPGYNIALSADGPTSDSLRVLDLE